MHTKPAPPEQGKQLSAINQIAQKVHTFLSVKEVVQITINEFSTALDFDLVMLFLQGEKGLQLAGASPSEIDWSSVEALENQSLIWNLAYRSAETIISPDIAGGNLFDFSPFASTKITSLAALPLGKEENIIGVLCLGFHKGSDLSEMTGFLEAMVSQVSIALSNAILYENALQRISEGMKVTGQLSSYQAQLEELVRRRTEEFRQNYQELQNEVAERKRAEIAERDQRNLAVALERSSAILNSTLDLEEVLDSILITLKDVIPHESANIMLIDHKDMVAFVVRYKGNPKLNTPQKPPTSHFPILETPTLNSMYQTHQPFMIPDVNENSEWVDQIGSDWIRSYMAAPILYGDLVLGFLNLVSDTPGYYKTESLSRLQAFANHASIAIRNARLYDQAREVAVLEERQRLARDMHDAVSQTLFAANVIAEGLPGQIDRDPVKAKLALERLRTLVRGALSEIRTILVELRPDALLKTDLGELIGQIAYGAMSYTPFELATNIRGNHILPEDVQLTVFRITQEIFNNIIKHSEASNVYLEFTNEGESILLKVFDDGKGFDTAELKPDRMGISIMHERADTIGAELKVSSQPGKGVRIQLSWSAGKGEKSNGK